MQIGAAFTLACVQRSTANSHGSAGHNSRASSVGQPRRVARRPNSYLAKIDCPRLTLRVQLRSIEMTGAAMVTLL